MLRSLTLVASWLVLGVFGENVREYGYIVEYKAEAGLKARDSLASKEGIQVLKTFDSPYFRGASIKTENFNVDSLIALPEVANVWRNNVYKLEPVNPNIAPTKEYALDKYVHNSTGVSKLHDAGYLGEGALVGIVDTGTAYKHPALGGCIGPECKVTGGYDLVGDVFWRPNAGLTKAPDNDPDDNQGHGTHVSGIVAGENDYWRGVAPKAKLRSYKVFSSADSPDSDDETVIEAFLMAVKDGCDIITCSIGNYNGWPQNAWAVVADRLTLDGIFVSISAGNEGSAGPFFGSTGSSGKNALAIASIANEKLPAKSWVANYAPKDQPATKVTEAYLPSGNNFPTTVNGWPIKPMTFDTTVPNDACEPYPAGTPRLDNVIPLVRRGTCAFVLKTQNLAALGAKYVLFYNNAGTITTPAAAPGVTAAMITADLGAKIVEIVKAGGNVTGDFSADSEIPAYVDWPAGGKASDFTSWGALNDLSVKPDVGAPGGQIYSTYLNGEYAVLSGTSMACPYIAGVAALWVGKNGGRAKQPKTWARDLGRRIISSGQMIPWYDGVSTNYNFTAPVEQVGTGLVDAYKVLNYDTAVDFEAIGLNDTRHFSRYHDVTVKNNGKTKVDYTFSHAPAAGFETYECAAPDDCRIKPHAKLSPIKLEVDVNLPRPFSLNPGESKTVSVNFQNPENKGWNAKALPAYSGNIRVKGSNGDELSVPYFGLAADLKEVVSPIYRKGFPVALSTPGDIPIEEKSNFTFDFSAQALDFPRIIARLKWGSAQIRWDIFEENWTERKWTWPLVPGKDGYIGTVHGIDKSTGQTDFPNVTVTFPVVWTNRNADEADWQILHEYWWPEGKLGDLKKIPKGTYLMRFAALNPFGNPNNGNNWSVFKTPKITVL